MKKGITLFAAAMLLAVVTTIIGCVDMPTNTCSSQSHREVRDTTVSNTAGTVE